MAVNVRIGYTLFTWNVFAHPENIEQGIRDIADLGYAGTETGGGLYDWWEETPRRAPTRSRRSRDTDGHAFRFDQILRTTEWSEWFFRYGDFRSW